jgi:hypothetical protein
MIRYAMLTHPGTNRVYAKDAPALALAEVRTVAELLPDHGFGAPVAVERAGASFVDIDVEADHARASVSAGGPTANDARSPATESVLAALASTFALFIVHGNLLEPIEARAPRRFGDDLLTILKYPGKTNEQFTALLLRLALAASRPARTDDAADGGSNVGGSGFDAWLDGEPLRVLDPLCGRGTTLNQSLRDGLDAIGIDADRKDIEAYLSFLARYLETNRIKHRRDSARPSPDGRRTLRTTYTITPRGAGDPNRRPLTLDVINDDTRYVRDHIKGSSAHVIVADLPYGIQHGARADARGESRNPAVLLAEALPVWRGVLRGGGAIALSYNTKVIKRDEVDAALAEVGLTVVDALADGRFSHRVDQSIQRDLSLATKPS